MGRLLRIVIAVIVVILIAAAVTVGLLFGLRKRETIPDLSTSAIYSNTKETELMDVNGVRVFGVKDFTGNVQSVHAIQTPEVVYMLDNDRLRQIQSGEYTLRFDYNDTSSTYYAMVVSENSSYEIPYAYSAPTVKLPEFEVDIPMDANISNPFTGIVIELADSLSQRLISDATLQLNYYDDQYGNRSVVMINTNGGRYYALLPINDAEMEKYFDQEKLYKTIPQQSNSLIELIQAYPIADICSKVPQTATSFCDKIKEEISTKLPDALRTASKYANHVPLRSASSTSTQSQFEIVISIPGERTMIESLDDVQIDPSVLTVILRQAKTSTGRCNEQTVAGADTPDDRTIDIGKGHVAINFHYETYTVEDQIDIYYTGEQIFSSGCVGTQGEQVVAVQLDDNETKLRVKVTPDCAGGTDTKWYYAIECPNQELICSSDVCYCGYQKNPSRQVLNPTFDGCGTHRDKSTYWFIHPIGNMWKFTPVCDEHDRCYGTCNNNRGVCDDSFYSQLSVSCKTNWGDGTTKYYTCLSFAKIFYWAVEIQGSDAFSEAQNEDCSCDKSWFLDRNVTRENEK